MSKFKIEPQEIYVWLACKDGWNRAAGFKCSIDGVECSAVLVPTKPITLAFNDWLSGSRIIGVPLPLWDVIMSDTKEKTLALIEENSQYVSKIIEKNGMDTVKSQALQSKEEFESKFGPMPDIEIIEEMDR